MSVLIDHAISTQRMKVACKELSEKRMYRCSAAKWTAVLKALNRNEIQKADKMASRLCIFCYNAMLKNHEHNSYSCKIDKHICDCSCGANLVHPIIQDIDHVAQRVRQKSSTSVRKTQESLRCIKVAVAKIRGLLREGARKFPPLKKVQSLEVVD